jgi:ribosomal protein L11 methylase PrmA
MQALSSSYRDRAGFVFEHHGKIYRYVHPAFMGHFTRLINSGLYDELVRNKWLIPHSEITNITDFIFAEGKVLLPEQLSFISYPYEWSFDMWKDASLLCLQVAMLSLQKDMVLKDATPFNIQFIKGRPVFIDTLSFENYTDGKPWVAYRQFCECFLGPLLLMHYCHADTNKLFTVYPNGIPLNVLATLLPARSKWNVNTFLHVHLQSKISNKKKINPRSEKNLPKQKLEILLKGLQSFVQKLTAKKAKSTWNDYYKNNILGSEYLNEKTAIVKSFISEIEFKNVIDLGANDGYFSLLFAADKNVIAADSDVNCINDLYRKIKKEKINNILPMVINLVAPSPAIGWNNKERDSITSRFKADLSLVLALVHHLAIANNIPLHLIADWLNPIAKHLIIEFVPKNDEKVKLLLQNREDIFHDYSLENFKSIFADKYQFLKEEKVGNTNRVLFLMKRK